MKTFKDFANEDISEVFFNFDEFAETHNIDGVDMVAIIDSDVLKIRSNYKQDQYDGVYKGELAVFVRETDINERPVFGQRLRLNGKLYLVVECTEDMGVLEIVLEANDS